MMTEQPGATQRRAENPRRRIPGDIAENLVEPGDAHLQSFIYSFVLQKIPYWASDVSQVFF